MAPPPGPRSYITGLNPVASPSTLLRKTLAKPRSRKPAATKTILGPKKFADLPLPNHDPDAEDYEPLRPNPHDLAEMASAADGDDEMVS